MKYLLSVLGLCILLAACTSTQKTSSSAVDVVMLNNYRLNDTVKLNEEITYKFLTKDEDFHQLFYMTKTIARTAIVPDSNTQSVVAIMVRPSTKVRTLQINKALISGDDFQVHYSLTDTSSASTFEQPTIVVATVPKATGIAKATFHSNGVKEYTINIERKSPSFPGN